MVMETEDGGRERTRRAQAGWSTCRQEMDRVRNRKEKDGVMTELQALCLYIHLQAN